MKRARCMSPSEFRKLNPLAAVAMALADNGYITTSPRDMRRRKLPPCAIALQQRLRWLRAMDGLEALHRRLQELEARRRATLRRVLEHRPEEMTGVEPR